MKLFEKIVNFINKVLGRNVFSETKYLPENSEVEREETIEIADENMKEIDNLLNEELDNSKEIYFDNEEPDAKKEFFEMYEAYKAGKINPDYLLITDLIQIEMMMQEEMAVLDRETKIAESNIKEQEFAIAKLEKEKIELESKKAN